MSRKATRILVVLFLIFSLTVLPTNSFVRGNNVAMRSDQQGICISGEVTPHPPNGKGDKKRAPSYGNSGDSDSVTISNDYLTFSISYWGDFTGRTAKGEAVLYPYDYTSNLTIKIGSKEYDYEGLYSYISKETYVNPNNNEEAITEWNLPEGIHIEQDIKLEGDHADFVIKARNDGDSNKTISIRYLWDTQLCDNDGSPLKAKGTLYTKEICFDPVDFDHWSAYSRPDESTAELVTYGWWQNKPDKIIFAHWPHAEDTTYSYAWDPNRRFYTPGYVTYPESDSCVLMYWENINVPANGEKSITAFYGTSIKIGLTLSTKLDKAEYIPNEMMGISVKVLDADGNSNYPLTRDNTEVKIDGNSVNIEDIIPRPNGEYLVKVRAPSGAGSHTVWVQVVTDQGYANDSKSFSVSGEMPTGTVSVSLNGNVDDATKDWKYPTKYKAPVFRRGTDNPMFILTLDDQLPTGYEGLFEVYSPNDSDTPIGSVRSIFCGIDGKSLSGIWTWTDTSGNRLNKEQMPVGIYTAKGYLVNENNPSNKVYIGSTNFYVIFDFDENMQSFVTWSTEPDFEHSELGPKLHDTYNLHLYDYPEIWENAIKAVNGAVILKAPNEEPKGAVDKISELARSIDGKMVYHHAKDDETRDFSHDRYDNDFDGKIDGDDNNEDWTYNYEPFWDKANSPLSGRAYNTSKVTCHRILIFNWCNYDTAWVDGRGNTYRDKSKADKMAWYFDTVKMLKEDFDPEDRIPDHTVSEPHQHSLGVCEDYAMLTVAYLRAIGIPSRVVSGFSREGGHAWDQWVDVTGDGKYHHLDVDFGCNDTDWKAEGSWRFNPSYYHAGGITWDHVFVRNSEDTNDVSDIKDQYNGGTHSTVNSGSEENHSTCNYKILGVPVFKPGEETTVKVNITNPTNESKTVNVTVLLISAHPPIGGQLSPLTGATKQVTIPANSEITEEFNITVPCDASSGDYNLDIYEEENLALQQATQVLPEYTVTTGMPDKIIYEQPFTFNVTVKNNETTSIHNVSVELDTHYYFNATDPLRKEIAVLNPGEKHTFTWMLTPIWHGDLRIGVGVSTADAGFDAKIVSISVLQTPKLWITPQVPEKVGKGEDFPLNVTIFNSGDVPSDPVTLSIKTPENVTADKTSADLGIIGGHKSKTCTFTISQNEAEDFVISLSAASISATAENYAFINIIQPDMFIDILKSGELPGIEQHTGVIETLADEPCSLTIYIKNTGDETLHNVQVLTNVGVTEDVGDISEGEIRQVLIQFTPTMPGLSGLNVTVRADEVEKSLTRTLLVEKFDFSVSIPKTEYSLNEPVPINISVTNETPNTRFGNVKVQVHISGPSEQTFELPLLSLGPLEKKNDIYTWDTTGLPCGNYTVTISLLVADQEINHIEKTVTIGSAKNIAFIYSNADKASSYKLLLQSEGCSVDLILKGDVLNHDYGSYDLIVIGPDTGFGYSWEDSNAESRISGSCKPVLGLGFGGASFFQDINLSINFGNGWIDSNDNSTYDDSIKVYVVDPLNKVFRQPYNISIPDDKIIQIYQNSGHIGEYAPVLPNSVVYYGREPSNDYHYSLVSEGKYFLWGFTNSPDYMTQVGKNLFINVVSYLSSLPSFPLHIPTNWSIISIPFNNTDASLLTSNTNIQYLFYWDGNFWQVPTTLQPGIGYLVYNTSSSTIDITLTGTPTVSPFTEQSTGNWQVIGNPFTTTATLSSTSTITYLFYWDGSFWQTADPNNLQPGVGYLILTDGAGTLTFTENP